MTDLILQTDPLEFQNSRQSTKIIFLQQELQQAQDYARDLEQIVKINKEALRIATNQQFKPVSKSKLISSNDTTSTVDTNSNREAFQNLQLLVEQLQEENGKFLEIVEKAKKERNIAQSKALISEQICEEAQRHESEIVHELEEKIADLRKLLQDKEYAIQELEKIKPIPEQEGVVIKYREILNATDQNIKLHNEIEALNGMLAKVSKELNKLQVEKQEIMTINFSLTNELAKIKATLSSPLNFPAKFGRMNSGGDLNNSDNQGMLLFQPPIEYMEENSPFPSPLGGQPVNEAHHSKAPVPKLDLSKAKHIQEQYAKKLTQPQQQNYGANYNAQAMDRVRQLEEELELTRKRLSHEMINNRLISEEVSKVYRHNRQLVGTNEILIKSNKRYEEKWQKIFYTLEFYKDFYHKYIDLITRGPGGHMKSASLSTPKFETFPRFKGKMFVDPESDPDKLIKELRRANEDNGKQVNVSILEANEEGGSEDGAVEKGKINNVYEFTKDQSKLYLLNLAKDLYVNSNLQKSSVARRMLQTLKFSTNEPATRPRYKVKRSMSNALEYVSERKKFIFEPQWMKNKNNGKSKNEMEMLNDQDNGLFQNLDNSELVLEGENRPEQGRNILKNKLGNEENISFTVDPDEFNKNKMVEASFISNNDILDSLKHD